MAFPGSYHGPRAQEDGGDASVMDALQQLYLQQDDHQALIAQTKAFQEYWDLQHEWNHCAQRTKILKEHNRQMQLQHTAEDEEERVQRLLRQHELHVLEEQLHKAKKERQEKELQKAQSELQEHRKNWKRVQTSLNEHQKKLHANWTRHPKDGDNQKRASEKNKELLQKAMKRLEQRIQQKQVCMLLKEKIPTTRRVVIFCSSLSKR